MIILKLQFKRLGQKVIIRIMWKLFDKLKEFDKFGQGAGFTIRGGETYGTGLGLVLTLIIYIIVLVYGN